MNIIAKHHHEAKTGEEFIQVLEEVPPTTTPHVQRAELQTDYAALVDQKLTSRTLQRHP